MFARQALAATLILLLAVPVWANPGVVVGTAASGRSVTVGGSAFVPGTTLFSGDTIEVGPRGSAWIALAGGGRLHLGADSLVRLSKSSERIEFELVRGSISFRASEKPVKGRLADFSVRLVGDSPATAALDLRDPKAAVIAAEKGDLALSVPGTAKTVTLREGDTMTVASPQGADNRTLSKGYVVLIGAGVIAIATVLGVILSREGRELTDQQKRNEVSPFRFP